MQRIFLIGYMGAGKTTLGKVLAQRMGLLFIDTDLFIENRYHLKISEMFATEGEGRFRQIEHQILLEISAFENIVVSTGGGMPCYSNNMDIMNAAGTTVFLDVSANELTTRLGASKTTRPILQGRTGEELRNFITGSLEGRLPFYSMAKIHFKAELMDTERDTEKLADELEKLIINNSQT